MTAPRFTTGPTMRHVAVMTATGAAGLMALFLVDAANLLYISMLGITELAAAIGFAGTIQFFMVSVSIGLSIAATALVSRAIGAGDRAKARRLAASALVTLLAILALVAAGVWVWRDAALGLIGAGGEAREVAVRFLGIVLPSMPLLGVGMVAGGFLRAVGDARRAMFVTLSGGIAAAVLDPLFIFGFGMGVDGAAVVSILARVVIAAVGLYGAVKVHDLIGRPTLAATLADARALLAIALPAVATQLSTPFGNAYLTGVVSAHGDEAVAGWAVVGRLTALAFGGIFALSGAVGPIIGQNYGAGLGDRIRAIYHDALIFAWAYVAVVWLCLLLLRPVVVEAFGVTGAGAEVISAFAFVGAGAYLFVAALFVSNAAFNVLGRAHYATALNWARDAGAIPLLALLLPVAAHAEAAVWVQAGAGALVGTLAVAAGWRYVARLRPLTPRSAEESAAGVAVPAFTSGRGIASPAPAAPGAPERRRPEPLAKPGDPGY